MHIYANTIQVDILCIICMYSYLWCSCACSNTYLWQIWDRLDTKALEDESQSLYGHGVVLRERLVLEDPHQRVDGNGRVEVLQAGTTAHRYKKLTGCVTSSCKQGQQY